MVTLEKNQIEEWDTKCYDHVRGLVKLVANLLGINGITSINLVDVGANVGTFTEKLNDFVPVKEAILIEPIDELIDFIKTKLPAHYTYVNQVASNVESTVNFYVNDTPWNLGMSKVIPNVIEDHTREIQTVTLTRLLNNWDFEPDFIKIDAENHDLEVLDGLFEYLLLNPRIRPVINFECSSALEPEEIIRNYESIGYKTYFQGDKSTAVEYFFLRPDMIPGDDIEPN